MTSAPVFLVAVLCAAITVGCAKREEAARPAVAVSESSGPGTASAAVTATATVEDVDQQARVVTLRTSDGERREIKVGDEVRNLAQVRKGDVVTATYYESIAVRLREKAPGEKPSVSTTEGLERAPLGAKPSGTVVRETTLTAKVTAIDRKTKKVTLEGPKGNSVKLHVQDAKNLEGLEVGELVEAVYREAVAISVDKPTK